MSSDQKESNFMILLLIIVMGVTICYVFSRPLPGYKKAVEKAEQGIFYCPECWTLYGKGRPCCPEEESADNKCIELKRTPYNTWDEYSKGTWRPWDE